MATEKEGETSPTYALTTKSLVMAPNISLDSLIVTNELNRLLSIYIYVIICGSVSIFGLLSNLCNLIIFYKLEIKDSMSVCLFSLSFTDFLLSLVVLSSRIFFIWRLVYSGDTLDPLAFDYIGPAWIADVLFLSSGWILAIMSLERCICVTLPFKVKQIFTKNRSIAAVIVVHTINMSTNIPIFMTQGLKWTSSKVNEYGGNETLIMATSRLIIFFSANRQEIHDFIGIFTSTVIPFPALFINLVSVFWMIYGLLASSKLRQSMTLNQKKETETEKQESAMKSKTAKLMKVVLLLAIIFLICSVPRIIANGVTIMFPHIHHVGKDRHFNHLLWQLARLFSAINASINIFVYLTINSSFREKFREVFIAYAKKMLVNHPFH